jgi:hypothetical protein
MSLNISRLNEAIPEPTRLNLIRANDLETQSIIVLQNHWDGERYKELKIVSLI